MIPRDPLRSEALLALAEELTAELRTAPVPYLDGSAQAGTGIPSSVVGHAVSYLHRVRDREAFAAFLSHFDDLDPMTAQNPDHPKADHRVTRQVIEAFLQENAELDADELLYLLSWVRRLLPKDENRSGNGGRPRGGPRGQGRHRDRPPRTPPPAPEPELRGGQMAAALGKLRRK